MDFYLSLDGAKAGPFSIFKVGELLESGEATPETLAWHRGLDGWKPVREIPALAPVLPKSGEEGGRPAPPPPPRPAAPPPLETFNGAPLPEIGPAPAATLAASIDPVRPFVRFWARMFDYTLVSVIVFQLSGTVFPQPVPGETFSELLERYLVEMRKPEALLFARTLFFAMLGWHGVEAVLIHLLGTTPGKALFGIRVTTSEGGRIPLVASLGRSFYVYVMGAGFYQFPFILVGMVFSFFRLTTTGLCLWDQHLRTRVEHAPLGAVRIMLAILAFFVLLSLQSVKFT